MLYKIRIHGRKYVEVLSHVLAKTALLSKFHIQKQTKSNIIGGNDKVGYIKISEDPIIDKSPVISPDYLLVLDTSLSFTQMFKGIDKNTIAIFNSPKKIDTKTLDNRGSDQVYLDATRISLNVMNKPYPVPAMAAAFIKKAPELPLKDLTKALKDNYPPKSIKAAKKAHKQVK